MVTYTLVTCPQCSAPLPTVAPTGVMHCDYCGVALVPTTGGVRLMQAQETELPAPGRTRLWAGGRRYILDGRVAKGSSSDVFLGRFDHRLSEQVVVKMLRAQRAPQCGSPREARTHSRSAAPIRAPWTTGSHGGPALVGRGASAAVATGDR